METTTVFELTARLVISVIAIFYMVKSYRKEQRVGVLEFQLKCESASNEELKEQITALGKNLDASKQNEVELKTELLELKDKCYIRKGRAFIPYRKYIAQELAAMPEDLKGYYEFEKKNKEK